MFTVKFFGPNCNAKCRQDDSDHTRIKIVCGNIIDVHILRPGGLQEITVHDKREGGFRQAFYIADISRGFPEGFADEVEFWSAAFIENANGATTEIIRA